MKLNIKKRDDFILTEWSLKETQFFFFFLFIYLLDSDKTKRELNTLDDNETNIKTTRGLNRKTKNMLPTYKHNLTTETRVNPFAGNIIYISMYI